MIFEIYEFKKLPRCLVRWSILPVFVTRSRTFFPFDRVPIRCWLFAIALNHIILFFFYSEDTFQALFKLVVKEYRRWISIFWMMHEADGRREDLSLRKINKSTEETKRTKENLLIRQKWYRNMLRDYNDQIGYKILLVECDRDERFNAAGWMANFSFVVNALFRSRAYIWEKTIEKVRNRETDVLDTTYQSRFIILISHFLFYLMRDSETKLTTFFSGFTLSWKSHIFL